MSTHDKHRPTIDAIPSDGGSIVVMRNDIGRFVMDGIKELRGKDVATRCRTYTVQHIKDTDKLLGLRGYIGLDYSFTEFARPDVKARVEEMVRSIGVMNTKD